jgi:hypothetical protein
MHGYSRLPATGPLRLDPHQAATFKDGTRSNYFKEGLYFFRWASTNNFDPVGVDQWDDFIVEYKNDGCYHIANRGAALTLGAFQNLIACVEWVHPRWRGQLGWSRSVARSWTGLHQAKHTFPCGIRLARLFASHGATAGLPRHGWCPVLQCRLGLRPGEIVHLCREHVLVHRASDPIKACLVFRLGAHTTGTKAKREQFAILWAERDPTVFLITLRLVLATAYGCRIFPFSLDVYRRFLARLSGFLLAGTGITVCPHGPRAGFVSDGILDGIDEPRLRTEGRWASESAFKTYRDVVGSLSVQLCAAARALDPAMEWVASRLESFFPGFEPVGPDAGCGMVQGPAHGRVLSAGHRLRRYLLDLGAAAADSEDEGPSLDPDAHLSQGASRGTGDSPGPPHRRGGPGQDIALTGAPAAAS